jgi:hypothetical protein
MGVCARVRERAHAHTHTHTHRMFKKELYNIIPGVTVLRELRKCLHLEAYKLSIVQRWIVCTPLSVNVFLTLATD